MENMKHDKPLELSEQDLAEVSGGAFVPDDYHQSPINDLSGAAEVIKKQLENTKLPYWNDNKPNIYSDKYSDSQTYSSESPT
ncbi:hypothetical protein GS682_13385 [Nostoc sp. B(2019)]|nr:hypothetical protein [Nostoc sp. B(2019)]